jgi:hypothetical protein
MPGCGRLPAGRAAGRGMEPPSRLVNGLLPGRGAGRGTPPSRLVNGLLPGRGPAGRGAGGASGARAAAAMSPGAAGGGVAGGAGAAGAALCSAAAAAAAMSPALAGADAPSPPTAGCVVVGAAVFLAAAFLVVFFAGAASVGCAGKTSFSLRTTGGSTVDDADLTNSPMSWSLARTTLLSTPSSLASSYTRTLATALLS